MLLFDSNFLDTFYFLLGNREMRLTNKPLLGRPGHFQSEVSKEPTGFYSDENQSIVLSRSGGSNETRSTEAATQTLGRRLTVDKGRSERFSVKMLSALLVSLAFIHCLPTTFLALRVSLSAFHLTAFVESVSPCFQLAFLPWLPYKLL